MLFPIKATVLDLSVFYNFSVLMFHLQFMAGGLSEASGIQISLRGNAHFAEMPNVYTL